MYQLKNYFNIRIYIIPISTLIYFVRYVALLVIFFTFQYGSTLMSDKTYHPRQFLIYIPIWFYFNTPYTFSSLPIILFTFQYGSTLICFCKATFVDLEKFTFQYGSTLIGYILLRHHFCKNLHSNMVLL